MVGKVVFFIDSCGQFICLQKIIWSFSQLLTAILKMGQTSQGHSDQFYLCTSRNLKKKEM